MKNIRKGNNHISKLQIALGFSIYLQQIYMQFTQQCNDVKGLLNEIINRTIMSCPKDKYVFVLHITIYNSMFYIVIAN